MILPKRTIEIAEKWIEMIKEPEPVKKSIKRIYHKQYTTTTNAGYTDYLKAILNGIQKKLGKKPSISYKFYPTKTSVIAVMVIKIGKTRILALVTQNTENTMSTFVANRIIKYLNTECFQNDQELIQHVTLELKHGFLGLINLKKKIQEISWFWVNNGKKH